MASVLFPGHGSLYKKWSGNETMVERGEGCGELFNSAHLLIKVHLHVITISSCLSNNMRQETVSFICIPPQDTEDYRYFDPKLLRVTDR